MEPSLSWTFLFQHLRESTPFAAHPLWLAWVPVAMVWFLFWARRAGWRRWAVVLRLLACCALAAALAEVGLRVPLPHRPLALIAAVDRSASIDTAGRRWQERFLAEVAQHLSPQDQLGVVVFAGRTEVAQWPSVGRKVIWPATDLEEQTTDISLALRRAAGLFPSGHQRRLLLLSDGNENRGEALGQLPTLRALGVEVFAAVPPSERKTGARVTKVHLPKSLHSGAPAWLDVVIEHPEGERRPVPLLLWLDGQRVGEQLVELLPGRNALSFDWRVPAPGAHLWRVGLGSSAKDEPGQWAEAQAVVPGPLRVLLVSPRPRSLLAQLWRGQGVEVWHRSPAALRRKGVDWDSLHAVVLEDLSGADIPAEWWGKLRRFAEGGGGVVLSGGAHTYGDSSLARTALAELLPVTLEPHRPPRVERAPLALFLILDRSNSMGYHVHRRLERSESESKLAYAKRALLAVVDQLRDSDEVGVIAFDSQMYEVAALQPLAENRSWLEANIPRIVPGGGTDFYDALEHARRALVAARSQAPHIILLTDGDTNRAAAEHEPLLQELERAGIRVTTIRIGDDTVNLEFLQSISQRTGGNFYHVRDGERLPELLLQETGKAMQQSARSGVRIVPRPARPSQLVQGLNLREMPDLGGYGYTRLKPEAQMVLSAAQGERTDPLLAVWNYGLGRVAALTASLGDGAETWVGWRELGPFMGQLLRWAARERAPAEVRVRTIPGPATIRLELESELDFDEAVLRGRLAWGEQSFDLSFVAEDRGRYVATLPFVREGMGELTLWLRTASRGLEERRWAVYVAGSAAPQGEEQRPPNRALLETLARNSGGEVDPSPGRVVARAGEDRFLVVSLRWVWLPLAMLAFVGDVMVRRWPAAR